MGGGCVIDAELAKAVIRDIEVWSEQSVTFTS